jgi:hypothetical protein
MHALSFSKKRNPALRLNLDSQSTYSTPLSHVTPSRGSVNDLDNTMVAEKSVASTRTPSPSAIDLSGVPAQLPSNLHSNASPEPKKIFVAKVPPLCLYCPHNKTNWLSQNPNFIFPSVKRVPNPALPLPPTAEEPSEEHDQESAVTHKSYIHSLTNSLRSFIHHPHPLSVSTDPESLRNPQRRRSISGPSLYIFSRHSPDWSITETDVYRNASPIPNPLIEHPELEKGFQRPKEWGEKTPDLIEAEAISGEMRRIERLRRERAGKERLRDLEEQREARDKKERTGSWVEDTTAGAGMQQDD